MSKQAGASEPLLVATRNEHKLRELAQMLGVRRLEPLPESVELPPEDGETFAANALLKARAAHDATGRAAIADDSGIEAADLGGKPGVRSARFAGEDATDEQNLEKLMHEVAAAAGGREVAYVCVLAYVNEAGEEGTFEGRCTGTLAEHLRGSGGFGYDPAFLPDDVGDGRTIAELSPQEKNALSHRGRAAQLLAAHLAGAGAGLGTEEEP